MRSRPTAEGNVYVLGLIHGACDLAALWDSEARTGPAAVRPRLRRCVTERVPTVRVEFATPRDSELLTRVIHDGLLPSHPWQEPAVFVDELMASASEVAA